MDPPNYLHLKFLQMEKLEYYQISFKDIYPVYILVLSKAIYIYCTRLVSNLLYSIKDDLGLVLTSLH